MTALSLGAVSGAYTRVFSVLGQALQWGPTQFDDSPLPPNEVVAPVPSPSTEYVFRIFNDSVSDKVYSVAITYRTWLVVDHVRVPIARINGLLGNAIRALIPTVSSFHGGLRLEFDEEYSSQLGLPAIEVQDGGPTDVQIQSVAIEFKAARAELAYRSVFKRLADQVLPPGSGNDARDQFARKMAEAATAVSAAKAKDLVKEARKLGAQNRLMTVESAFDEVGAPLSTFEITKSDRRKDFAFVATLEFRRIRSQLIDVTLAAEGIRGDFLLHARPVETWVPLPGVVNTYLMGAGQKLKHRAIIDWDVQDVTAVVNALGDLVGGAVGDVADWLVGGERKAEEYLRGRTRTAIDARSDEIDDLLENIISGFLVGRNAVLHSISVSGTDLLIESLSTDARPRRRLPRAMKLLEPVDGPIPASAKGRLKSLTHIIVIMMENRSFDHMLGYISHPEFSTVQWQADLPRRIRGLSGTEGIPRGGAVSGPNVRPGFNPRAVVLPDPGHSYVGVARQIADGRMDGFIADYARRFAQYQSGTVDEASIMECQNAQTVPIFDAIVREFGVCDRWFSSFPGGTFPNRSCLAAGQTPGLENGDLEPELGFLTDLTLFDLLDTWRVPWVIYESDITYFRAYQRLRTDFVRIQPIDSLMSAKVADLPPVIFVEPDFTGLPSSEANDDHPPTRLERGQRFIAEIYNKFSADRSFWDNALMIVTYDEHGGFYDHYPPPGTTVFRSMEPTYGEPERVHPNVEAMGPRVPTLLLSPRIERESCFGHIYDHTTIIRTILERFAPDAVQYMPGRVRQARHLGEVLGRRGPRQVGPIADAGMMRKLGRARKLPIRMSPQRDDATRMLTGLPRRR